MALNQSKGVKSPSFPPWHRLWVQVLDLHVSLTSAQLPIQSFQSFPKRFANDIGNYVGKIVIDVREA